LIRPNAAPSNRVSKIKALVLGGLVGAFALGLGLIDEAVRAPIADAAAYLQSEVIGGRNQAVDGGLNADQQGLKDLYQYLIDQNDGDDIWGDLEPQVAGLLTSGQKAAARQLVEDAASAAGDSAAATAKRLARMDEALARIDAPAAADATSFMAQTASGFSSTTAVSPSSTAGSFTIKVSVKSQSAATGLVDLFVYGPDGKKVTEKWWENQSFSAGQTRTYTLDWKAPAGARSGTYTVSVGVFSSDWKQLRYWGDAQARFKVTSGSTQQPTATPTRPPATPTTPPAATSTPTRVPATPTQAPSNPVPVDCSDFCISGSAAASGSTVKANATINTDRSGSYVVAAFLFKKPNFDNGPWDPRENVALPGTFDFNFSNVPAGDYDYQVHIWKSDWSAKVKGISLGNVTVGTSSAPVTPTATTTAVPTTPTATTSPVTNPSPIDGKKAFGVNMGAAEYGRCCPGSHGSDYQYPNASYFDYWKSHGLTIVRLPFRWERMQRSLNAPLDQTELGRLKAVADIAAARGMKIIPSPQNFGKYNGQNIGTAAVPYGAFEDFWRRLAQELRGHPGIWAYGLMNEPATNGEWIQGGYAAGLRGIRASDSSTLALVPGDDWTGAWSWGWSNRNKTITVNDPNFMIEAHQYFDKNGSGTYGQSYDGEGAYPNIGVDRLKPFEDWLRSKGYRGWIGEYGAPVSRDGRWGTVLQNTLQRIADSDVLTGGAAWQSGPWGPGDDLDIDPVNGQDHPTAKILFRFPTR
jgi:endoglucanase